MEQAESQNQSQTSQGQDNSISPAPEGLIEQAKKERLASEKLLEEIKKQKAELEALHVRAIMGGSALAGSKQTAPKTYEQELDEKAELMAQDAVKRLTGRLNG